MSWFTKIFGHKQDLQNQDSAEQLNHPHQASPEQPVLGETVSTLNISKESLIDNYVLIRGGEFTMGSPEGEVNRQTNETQHQVKLSDFYMSKYTVTVAEFRRFLEASGYQAFSEIFGWSFIISNGESKKGDGVNWRHGVSGSVRPQSEENHPVLYVSWYDAVAYCKWLSTKTGKQFRLPTEAEWEYACRAGSKTAFNFGENLTTNQANYNGYHYKRNPEGGFRQNTVEVNSFAPNAWGLYNMHGNVYEWCSDWYSGTYYDDCKAKGTVYNPAGPASGSNRVFRGGSWRNHVAYCRSADRGGSIPSSHNFELGFRLVFVP